MSFFNWLFGKPSSSLRPPDEQKATANAPGEKRSAAAAAKPDAAPRESAFAAMRHARREQLFRAIRDAMTQAGVLSFRYKFKVLSQDRRGNSFVALMDLTQVNGDGTACVSEMEALIVQSAAKRYDIAVSAVYWRFNELQAVSRVAHLPGGATPTARPEPVVSSRSAGNEPIHADEITAFRRALNSASALRAPDAGQGAPLARAAASPAAAQRDFEDTKTTQEAASFPALSSTQYGDLR